MHDEIDNDSASIHCCARLLANAVVIISNNVVISNNKARPVLFSWCFRLGVCATASIL